jgi:hypothetical protein
LHFRVEVTEIKVADCLQILASLRDALFPNSDAEAEDEDPGVEGDGVLHPETSTPGKRKEEEMQEDSATAAERTQEQDEPGHYETVYMRTRGSSSHLADLQARCLGLLCLVSRCLNV